MDVVFRRTGARRYSVSATVPGRPTVTMDPAPGYDPHLPHDLIHFVVEEELELSLGVFGQLAEGGDAGSFRLPPADTRARERTRMQRRLRRRGESLGRAGEKDAQLSERAASICHHAWLSRSDDSHRLHEARAMAPYLDRVVAACSEDELDALSGEALERICARLDELSIRWLRLAVGDELVLTWDRESRAHA